MQRPIVLVHGAWHGPWCWDAWASRFRADGHDVVTVTLPDHDRPGDPQRLWKSMGSYVRAVTDAVDAAGPDAILLGHSMGGLISQRVAETRRLAGVVLLASVPRFGVGPFIGRLSVRAPARVARVFGTLSLWPMVNREDLVRESFYSVATPEDTVAATAALLQNESVPATLSMTFRWPRPSRVASPVLVVSGGLDTIFPPAGQRRLAATYDADHCVMARSCHNVMMDVEQDAAAQLVLGWISRR
ncbi:MAG: alpha/beta hydrolase [Acidimicrobiales bacterium]|nr:MAG: alpha/beta hydrolase [Acidimicrobiales bacterium]